jgi:hypothetical protein
MLNLKLAASWALEATHVVSSHRSTEKAQKLAEILFFTWAQGYMSALNIVRVALKKPIHDLKAWSISAEEQNLRTFCDQRPLAMFTEAIQDLYDKLPLAPPQSN